MEHSKFSQFIELQKKLRGEVRQEPLKGEVRLLAGADVSMERFGHTLYAGIVVLTYPELAVVEEVVEKMETDVPYIPGLLSFREMPALLKCVKKLSYKPDVYMVDGQGIAHPRRLGIAAHLGLEIGVPTIGCAKSILYGKVEGGRLIDPKSCEVLGEVLKTRKGSNPLIISPGHLITLEESVRLVRGSLKGYKLPEPTRRAHLLVDAFRKGIIKN